MRNKYKSHSHYVCNFGFCVEKKNKTFYPFVTLKLNDLIKLKMKLEKYFLDRSKKYAQQQQLVYDLTFKKVHKKYLLHQNIIFIVDYLSNSDQNLLTLPASTRFTVTTLVLS